MPLPAPERWPGFQKGGKMSKPGPCMAQCSMTAAESAAAPDQLLKACSVAVGQVCSTENPTALSLGDLPAELCHLWQIYSPTLPPPTPSNSQKCLIIPFKFCCWTIWHIGLFCWQGNGIMYVQTSAHGHFPGSGIYLKPKNVFQDFQMSQRHSCLPNSSDAAGCTQGQPALARQWYIKPPL